MKFKVIPYFSIILILLIPLNAFGDSVNVSVDLPIFTDADKIVIYGSLSIDTVLQVMIIDPDDIVVVDKSYEIDAIMDENHDSYENKEKAKLILAQIHDRLHTK